MLPALPLREARHWLSGVAVWASRSSWHRMPGGQGTASGGERAFVRVLARAAVAVGVAGVFIETHQDPDHAPSDGPNMVPLKDFEALVAELQDFDRLVKRNPETA